MIGIVASRLKERYDRPACVVALIDGVGRGSGRSIAGLPIGPAIIAARQAGLLINGGGHAMAAGFTVAAAKLDAFREFLVERLGDGLDRERRVPELRVDGVITLGAAQADLIRHIERLAPFGAGNPEPELRAFRCESHPRRAVGNGHLRCTLAIRSTRPGCGRSHSEPSGHRSASSLPKRAASRCIWPVICVAIAGSAAMPCSSRSMTLHR